MAVRFFLCSSGIDIFKWQRPNLVTSENSRTMGGFMLKKLFENLLNLNWSDLNASWTCNFQTLWSNQPFLFPKTTLGMKTSLKNEYKTIPAKNITLVSLLNHHYSSKYCFARRQKQEIGSNIKFQMITKENMAVFDMSQLFIMSNKILLLI